MFTGLPAFPELGKEIFADDLSVNLGGSAIVAAGLEKLGAKVGLIADLGTDTFSQIVRGLLDSLNLDSTLVREHPYPMPQTTVALSYPEDRAFITRFQPAQSPPDLESLFQAHPAPHLHYCGFLSILESPLAASIAHKARMTVSADTGWDTDALMDPRLRSLVAELDVFMPSSSEICYMAENEDYRTSAAIIADTMLKDNMIVVKRGGSGATLFVNGEARYQAAALPVQPVDTTGAGDAFDAGFLYAYLNGKPIEECTRYGVVCGSLSTTGIGGINALPSLAEVESWLQRLP